MQDDLVSVKDLLPYFLPDQLLDTLYVLVLILTFALFDVCLISHCSSFNGLPGRPIIIIILLIEIPWCLTDIPGQLDIPALD